VLEHRFGLRYNTKPKTLHEFADILCLTPERIRQIQLTAQHKLRSCFQPEFPWRIARTVYDARIAINNRS
jgi:DNA-directed RNA polymerase sigma subunit (sigma70/sigma32)